MSLQSREEIRNTMARSAINKPKVTTRRLTLFRHAKSAWDQPELADHDRVLAPRGLRAAKVMGHYLHQNNLLPDLVLCSSAVRARDTLELAKRHWPDTVAVTVDSALYLCGVQGFISRLRQVEGNPDTIMLVAHNPDLHDLATTLLTPTDSQQPEALAMRRKYPTGAIAIFDLAIPDWASISAEPTGKFVAFQTPKSLTATAG